MVQTWACYERYTRLNWEVKEDTLEQPIDQKQLLANILPSPTVPQIVSNVQGDKENKLLLEQLASGKLILQKNCM